jgi:hypothetical protein
VVRPDGLGQGGRLPEARPGDDGRDDGVPPAIESPDEPGANKLTGDGGRDDLAAPSYAGGSDWVRRRLQVLTDVVNELADT